MRSDGRLRPRDIAPRPLGVQVIQGPAPAPGPARGEKSREIKNIRVDIQRLDQMMNLVETW